MPLPAAEVMVWAGLMVEVGAEDGGEGRGEDEVEVHKEIQTQIQILHLHERRGRRK